MKLSHIVAFIALAAAAAPASAQAVDVAFGGSVRDSNSAPLAFFGAVAFDPARPGEPFNGVVDTFTPVERGSITFAPNLNPSGDTGPSRSFGADQLSYTYARIADSLAIRVRVNPEALRSGERAELLFGNAEGNMLIFPAYQFGPQGGTTARFVYTLAGLGRDPNSLVTGGFLTNIRRGAATVTPTPVPEPAPFALFGIAIAVFVAARRYARPRAN